jgi:hypothetical protein
MFEDMKEFDRREAEFSRRWARGLWIEDEVEYGYWDPIGQGPLQIELLSDGAMLVVTETPIDESMFDYAFNLDRALGGVIYHERRVYVSAGEGGKGKVKYRYRSLPYLRRGHFDYEFGGPR